MSALREQIIVTPSAPIPLAATSVAVHLAIDSKVMEPLVEVSTQDIIINQQRQKTRNSNTLGLLPKLCYRYQ